MKYRPMILIAAAIVLIWTFGIWLGPEGEYSKPEGELVGGEPQTIPEPIHTIDCQWASGDIQITASPDNYVYIQTLQGKESGGNHAMSHMYYEGKLTIEDDMDEGFVDRLIGEEKNQLLILQLPKDGIESLSIEQDIGDVNRGCACAGTGAHDGAW